MLSVKISSRPFKRAPPPVKITPLFIISPANSGGVFSSTSFTAPITDSTGSIIASLTCSAEIVKVFGKPLTRSLPLISVVSPFLLPGNAVPTAFLISSPVRSPIIKLNSRLTYFTMASSNLSPPTLIDLLQTIPPRERTATSVVPPPTSTIMLPLASAISKPAPRAAATGSSIK